MCADSDDENRPVTPSDEDCCHNACDPCIFDSHGKLVKEYEKRKKQNIKITTRKNILSESSYKSFVISDVYQAAENYLLLTCNYQEDDDARKDVNLLINPGQYVMLHSWNLTRSYTPISWTNRTIQFLIKLYFNGKFSKHLRNIKVGDIIHIRGPYGNFEYKLNSFQKIIMFSMGSGLAAILPIAKAITENELDETKIHLIGAFDSVSQIPLKKELQTLSDYWNCKCSVHISRLVDDTTDLHGIDIKIGRLSEQSVYNILENCALDTTQILICGTKEFCTSIEKWTKDMNYTHTYMFK